MGCIHSTPEHDEYTDDYEDNDEALRRSDIVVTAAGEYVLAAAALSPMETSNVDIARERFVLAYNVLVGPRALPTDALAYLYARCVLNAHRARVVFEDAPPELLADGVHRPFGRQWVGRGRRLSV